MIALYVLTGICLGVIVAQPYLSRLGERRLTRDMLRLHSEYVEVCANLARTFGTQLPSRGYRYDPELPLSEALGCTCMEGIVSNFEHHEPSCDLVAVWS